MMSLSSERGIAIVETSPGIASILSECWWLPAAMCHRREDLL